MKYLLGILVVLALFLGFAPQAHAANFHVQVLDPNICISDPSVCIVLDPSAPINLSLDAAACQLAGVPGLGSLSVPFGCAILVNFTLPPQNITSLNLTFSGLGDLTFDCPTAGVGSVPGLFSQAVCGQISEGVDAFSFSGGSLPFLGEAVIFETGIDPDLFANGTATVNQPPLAINAPVPEPPSMLLLSTGAMMAGLFLTRNRKLVAFAKR